MDIQSTLPHALFPSHGPLACRRCFSSSDPDINLGPWRAVNDPGAWGSATPKVLVLGFSKGFTQAEEARSGPFDEIPFKKMRPRLSQVLQVLGILQAGEHVDGRMVATEVDLAFGSLVRCSLSRYSVKKKKHLCTGEIMVKAFTETAAASIVKRCAETYLMRLPPSVRLVVMLGSEDRYIKGCRQTIKGLYGAAFAPINDVAYRTGSVTWVHASHPSPLNGHHGTWLNGDVTTTPGSKRDLALKAVRGAGLAPLATHAGDGV